LFQAEGISHIGVIQGQHYRTDSSAPKQIASVQTLARRDIPQAGLVVIDECHLQFQAIKDWLADPDWQHVPFVGLSATPWAKGMGKHWHALLQPVSISDLIKQGYLSKFRVLAPPGPDLQGVRTTAGDYNEADLSKACDRIEIVGHVIETWFKRAENRPTLVYGVDRKHAQHLQERFIEAGISAEYVDCDTPMFEREEVFERFQSSESKVICNVATLDTGIDLDVRCIVDARPTKSRIRFVQTIGRGLRPAECKDHCLILDHAGNHHRLGLVTDIGSEILDEGLYVRSAERHALKGDERHPPDRADISGHLSGFVWLDSARNDDESSFRALRNLQRWAQSNGDAAHGEQGGPSVCPVCAGKWHAEHGRKRRAGRVVIRAIKAFEEAGGQWTDVDKLKMSTLHGSACRGDDRERLAVYPSGLCTPLRT
jgi:hypothetical protein